MVITIHDPATIEMLAQTDEAGVKLYAPDGRCLGQFVRVPRPELPEPFIVDGGDRPKNQN